MTKYVYDFSEGGRQMADLLGGKGANLGEMTKLGLPVPPGFTISTEACKVWLAQGREPDGLRAEVDEHLASLEAGGYIQVTKGYAGRRPRTWYSLTPEGRTALDAYIVALREIVNAPGL